MEIVVRIRNIMLHQLEKERKNTDWKPGCRKSQRTGGHVLPEISEAQWEPLSFLQNTLITGLMKARNSKVAGCVRSWVGFFHTDTAVMTM